MRRRQSMNSTLAHHAQCSGCTSSAQSNELLLSKLAAASRTDPFDGHHAAGDSLPKVLRG